MAEFIFLLGSGLSHIESSPELEGFSIHLAVKSRYELTVDHFEDIRRTRHQHPGSQVIEEDKAVVKIQPFQ